MALELAGRGTRLGARFIDGLVNYWPGLILGLWACVVLIGRFQGGAMSDLSAWAVANMGSLIAAGVLFVLYMLAILVVQIVMLHRHGQTIGKRIMKIKIVKFATEENGGFGTNFAMRALIPWVIGMIPYAGWAFSLIDILFIFREDNRCLHDLIADTKVVKA